MNLGLTTEQLAERKLRLHAGDSPDIMAGNYRAVYRRIKFGEEEDLYPSLPWFIRKNMTREQLEFAAAKGNYTEPFNLAWTQKMTGREIAYYSANPLMQQIWFALTEDGVLCKVELVVCTRHPFMACNIDGMTTTPEGYPSVIDAKDLSRVGEAEIIKYTPYGVWQAICAGTDWWGLSIISGGRWEPPVFQEVDPYYRDDMIARATECWGYIERGEEPAEAAAAPVLPPKPTPKLRSIVAPTEEDEVWAAMVRKDNWLSEARDHIRAIIGTDAAAKVNAIHRSSMAGLVPAEVGEVLLGRYKGKRDKAGVWRQSVTKLEEDDDAA